MVSGGLNPRTTLFLLRQTWVFRNFNVSGKGRKINIRWDPTSHCRRGASPPHTRSSDHFRRDDLCCVKCGFVYKAASMRDAWHTTHVTRHTTCNTHYTTHNTQHTIHKVRNTTHNPHCTQYNPQSPGGVCPHKNHVIPGKRPRIATGNLSKRLLLQLVCWCFANVLLMFCSCSANVLLML